MRWYHGYGPMTGGMLLWVVLVSLVAGTALVVALVALRGRRSDSATRVLDERLARGDIDAEEYERVRRALRPS
ncbi:SHOCT domain-containing protein [Saccharothrix longispora]|uniref:SHOCT domain-containing protein n=1 Tax=Saccharothrix longispora TaxID=33920 RepID=UPI0028FD9288|nr:SHOCT domain-containing protein [Saccharothrix longispora]MDU0288924.1 SHOCT domain-containing protein [Saccharothrix longispora]